MASSASEEAGTGRSLEGVSNGQQRCQSSEALAEWRSSEQLENGTPSTSPPYWDSDDDEDAGPKPSELYGKYTWKIDKFSQINKRELRSNAFEVGGFKWYILIYPQGCDVCNHLSLFLCVANHDKLLPGVIMLVVHPNLSSSVAVAVLLMFSCLLIKTGWSHFAQFTIAVVNKDPKKSKYSDTLHRFWKKEHDWGWKKFMELSKVLEGFIDADTLIIKAQVQVIRERADRPFRCLDCQYRRELVRVYLTNVEQICRRFVEERRGRLGKLIEDKARWSSFCAFWLGMDQNSRCSMSREKSDSILKVLVKYFFVEKEVTSTLVMDSLYSGLKAIEGQTKGKKGKGKHLDAEEQLVPIVRLAEDMFVLVDDVLLLLERAALEPLPPKDEKGPQNRTKDGASGEDFNKDSIVRDERRLTELGRRTIEIFVLAHIFSKIEVAYQEAVALKRQEELIREEEASWLAETELKAKKASDKEKKSKKKQGKQKKNNRKTKDKGRDEKICITEQEKAERDGCIGDGNDYEIEEPEAALGKTDILEDVSDISDSVDCVPEANHPDLEDRGASPVNWDTDTSEMHPITETSCSGLSGLSSVQNGISGKSLSVMDDSSSTCSTDSVPSAATNAPYRGTSNHKNQKSPSRVANHRSKSTSNAADCASETHSQPVDALPDAGRLSNTPVSCGATRSESQAIAHSHEQEVVKKKIVVSQQRKLTEADTERPPLEKPHVMSPPRSPPKSAASAVQSKSELKVSATSDPNSVKRLSLESPKLTHKSTTLANSAETAVLSKADPHKVLERHTAEKPSVHSVSIIPQNFQSRQVTSSATTEKPKSQVPALSRPLSAPVVPGPRPATPVVSMVPASPVLARSVSAAGQLGSDPSPATHSYVPQSYRNAIVGNPVSGSSAGFSQPYSQSPVVNSSQSYPQSPSLISGPSFLPQGSERIEPSCIRPSFSYGMMNHDTLQNGLQWESSQRDSRSMSRDHASMINEFQNFDLFKPVNSRTHDHIPSEFPACTSGRQSQSALADEFPHLDIINDLLDDEHGIGRTSMPNTGFHQSYNNGSHHLNRHFSFPGDIGMPAADLGPSTSSCRFERTRSYHDEIQHNFSGGPFDSVSRDMIRQPNPRFISGQIDGLVPNQWQMMGSDPSFLGMRNVENDPSYPYHVPDYSNVACGVNGFGVYRPPNGL
ncbi:TNF receptor-associated factor homolog 1b-like isoform X1 [Nicotiana tomentosiformis]|uniref:TNF receptor-associated factor homolog 1b-like isoform X1 n=1 Tax=Nicotiana tomentosiformis TaxID=4098 RepID=UPI0014458032|nr:TNF receptor-associated factor homolog 1b-like isoform X1 [Nicotiana tomentosiformis]